MTYSRKLLSVVVVLLVWLCQFSACALVTNLPKPPDRGQFTGNLGNEARDYSGGIVVMPERQKDLVIKKNETIGTIVCSDAKRTVEVKEKADWGLSLTGPLDDDEVKGILEATKDLRPSKGEIFEVELQGDKDENRTWTHSVTIKVIHYKIYAEREAGKNELLGIMVVEEPLRVDPKMKSTPCPPDPKPKVKVPRTGDGFIGTIDRFIKSIFVDFPNRIGLFSFGTVKVYSGKVVHAAAHLRSGDSVEMRLPEGSYVARALIRIIGIPFEWKIGEADGPVILVITLTSVEIFAYIVAIVVFVIIIYLIYKLLRRFLFPRAGAGRPADTVQGPV